jgi:hypothetical protein
MIYFQKGDVLISKGQKRQIILKKRKLIGTNTQLINTQSSY